MTRRHIADFGLQDVEALLNFSHNFSEHQRIGFDFMAYAVLLTALYLLLVRIVAWPYVRLRIGGLLAAISIVLSVAYIAWSVTLWIEWWGLLGELRMPPLRPGLLGMTWLGRRRRKRP